jgi:hypothetical protein
MLARLCGLMVGHILDHALAPHERAFYRQRSRLVADLVDSGLQRHKDCVALSVSGATVWWN